MAQSRLLLSRSQILGFRRRVGSLDERLPKGRKSLRRAAWAGLQDSMPRAALLSIHARVKGTVSTSWEHECFVQIWGPRFSAYVVAAPDLAVFSLGRLPEDDRGRKRAEAIASRLEAFLQGRRLPFGQAGREMGVQPNSLRYGAPTGRILLRWEAAHQPVVWSAPAPSMDPRRARLELARRYLHIFGPATPASFAAWAGVRPPHARAAFEALGRSELVAVGTPIGDAWILADDEVRFRSASTPVARARLLPSGDTYYLLWGADRDLLVPDAKQQARLWTSRVWPGAILLNGEIVGIWRRSGGEVALEFWRKPSPLEREAVEAEALSLPVPGLTRQIALVWR
ncbi:MAG: crosslink repair DNA glycosylase YcaQ family protein [Burkholderiaceae bacterium]